MNKGLHSDCSRLRQHIEFQTDAGKVNTTAGWKDMKIGIFAMRPRGLPAAPEHWATRDLPQTTCRYAFAAIETSGLFGARWGVCDGLPRGAVLQLHAIAHRLMQS